MSESFIKLIRSEEARYLMRKFPNAFILLTFIADRARRENGHPDGLNIGQCHLGDYLSYGLTEQQYRTAKKILEGRGHIKIIETSRSRKTRKNFKKIEKIENVKKSTNESTNETTTRITTIGTLVELCSSSIYDINPTISNHRNDERINERNDDRSTTDQRPINDEQEGRRRKKKEKEEQPHTPSFEISSKIKFREFVFLSQEQYDSLIAKYGKDFVERMLDVLDSYKGSKGIEYKSDYHVMKDAGWVVERVKKDLAKVANENNLQNASRDFKPTESRFESSKILRGTNEFERDKEAIHG